MIRLIKLLAGLLLALEMGAVLADAGEAVSVNTTGSPKWLDRVVPLPKEALLVGTIKLAARDVRLAPLETNAPAAQTAAKLIGAFALGDESARFTVRAALTADERSAFSRSVRSRLQILPNADQAYALVPMENGDGVLLLANTPQGILYASRTLTQLVNASGDVGASTLLEIPIASVTDWPDMPERGQWGGNAVDDLPWTSRWKLNVLEVTSTAPALYRQGAELGVKIVPMITHLEQMPIPPEYRGRKDMVRVPDPSKPLPSDYRPSLCMSSSGTRQLIGKLLADKAAIVGVTDIMVWLSEVMTRCFCAKCSGKEPYDLEVACILKAFDQAKAVNPQVRLRLLTTQGSYPVNDRILAAVPKDVGVTYYDGGRTYDSSRRPMIYPLLEEYARSGRWLGVYPQITHSWRTVFPWTAPQFIRFRAQEFVDKKLQCMIGYAVPSNRFHEFNVMAMAEWTWNAGGRSPAEFARAYATVTGVCDPELFEQWAVRAGESGWSLAESNLLLRLIYDPALGLRGDVPFDHRFQAAEISNIEKLNDTIENARETLRLAREAGNPDMVAESECVLAGLEAFAALDSASKQLAGASLDDARKQVLGKALDRLDLSAWTMRSRLLGWGDRVRGGRTLPTRLLDTAFVLLRACDAAREKATSLGIADPHPEYRLKRVGSWSADDFRNGQEATLRFDLTGIAPKDGASCQVGFDFRDSAYGADIKGIVVIKVSDSGESVAAQTSDLVKRVSRWERWCEMRIDVPAPDPGERVYLQVQLSGLPQDAPEDRRTCSGTIGIRLIRP